MLKHLIKTPIILGLALSASASLMADTDNIVHLGKSASKNQIIELLQPAQQTPMLTRGLHLRTDQTNSLSAKKKPRGISLEVFFEFDSAKLTAAAKEQLTPVGEALSSEKLASVSFVFEGHTDASGSENYNLSLSERRAKSVKKFFLSEYSLDNQRINTEGKGESALLDPEKPFSGSNRRVTIIAK